MKKIGILVTPLMAMSLLVNCGNKGASSYTITWKNYDGSILEVDENVEEGEIPHYDHENPKRPDDEIYSYFFIGWEPELKPVIKSQEYIATYQAVEMGGADARFKITIPSYALSYDFAFTCTTTSTLSVDWGDGNTNSNTYHMYSAPGQYDIKIYGVNSVSVQEDLFLEEVYLNSTIDFIGDEAFSYCIFLTYVYIFDGVVSLGENAFISCASLTFINIPSSVTSIGDLCFCQCFSLTSIEIPGSVTSIGVSAFKECIYLERITLNEGLVTIGSNSFSGCGLTSIDIPSSVGSIGEDAFQQCMFLEKVTLNEGLQSIGYRAFDKCLFLTSINIPSTVISIAGNPFSFCPLLSTITVNENNPIYDSRDNSNAIISKEEVNDVPKNTLIAGCKNTIIPSTITSIGDSAFEGSSFMISISIPNGVTSIGEYAFRSCESLEDINIPNTVTSIGSCAFYDSNNLKYIDLTAFTDENNIPSTGSDFLKDFSGSLLVNSETMARAFINSGKGWPTDISVYNWDSDVF